ncbi:orc1/cdc6 family replication initiation protein [Candidatus Woesearchaeota archaeon]|nr:orc1/cdc6 family replication initiation protein [Candidatus Woesearchaeota archaeon]
MIIQYRINGVFCCFSSNSSDVVFDCIFFTIKIFIKGALCFSIGNGGEIVAKEKNLDVFFQNYLKKESVFVNKQSLQVAFVPDEIVHRDDQVRQIASVIAPALRFERPSNLFVYGKTGTGKTLTVKHTTDRLVFVAKNESVSLQKIYVNCKLKNVADTEYRLIASLARQLGKPLPSTGLPTEDIYKAFFSTVDSEKQLVILILDEIDQLVKKAGDDVLYNLTRINEELKNSQISLIGISNDLLFVDNLDPRVKSSLSEEELLFPPYNALQLQDLLLSRSAIAFRKGAVESGVVEKCAAFAAREHGDARRALELLRVAGELADRRSVATVGISDVDAAEEKIEKDKIVDLVITQPRQAQLVLYSVVSISNGTNKFIFTGEVYEMYKKYCVEVGLRPLTQRRLSDILSEFDMLGIITARVISKGRYGRTREIMLAQQATTPAVKRILEESLNL